MTTHKTVTHKLFHSPRSSFCIVKACAGGHTTTGRPSSFTKWIIIIVIIMICDPYFSWYAETGKTGDTASSKNLRRLPECNIQFQMMLFESLSHSYFLKGITCVAVQLVADCGS